MSTQIARHRRPATLAHLLLVLLLLVGCQAGDPPAGNLPPVAGFTASPAAGPAPLTVSFDASPSFDPDGTIAAYAWSFGNGATATGVNAVATYTSVGTYTARLTVTDDRGRSASSNTTIVVGASPVTGGIAGTLTAGADPSGADAPRSADPGSAATGPENAAPHDVPRRSSDGVGADGVDRAEVVPGEVIVKFRSEVALASSVALTFDGVRIESVRPLALAGTQLLRLPGAGREETLALAEALTARPDVVYAVPNYVLRAFATPNDPFYPLQWHYPALRLPEAWDVTTGSAATVVAVGDTGILFAAGNAAASHPDFAGRVLPGYDFVSDPQSGGDGNGRDPDAYDLSEGSSHGTHVAGTIAAATQNGVGVAGVDWAAKVVPVRMLGVGGGGSLVDVVEGALWAAGFAVAGVPANPNPAHVLNLSLGGSYTCTAFEQEAFDRIATSSVRRTIVVVAAGNENQNAANASPASCRNVVTVGATEFRDFRAPYSNYGSRIDVMAPGGDVTANRNGDGFVDGVLSLDRFEGGFGYTFLNGTSMAAPHVAGVVSLMKALDPDLTLDEALALLKGTARPLSTTACQRAAASDCGAGLVDAAAALVALRDGDIPNPGGGALAFSPNPVDFASASTSLQLTLSNGTAAPVSWEIDGYEPSLDNPGEMEDLAVSASPLSGTVPGLGSASVTLNIDRSRVTADGAYQFELFFLVAGVEQSVSVRFRAGAPTGANPSGPTIVAAFVVDADDELVLNGFQEAATFFDDYDFDVGPGNHVVIAWTDENDNLEIDEGDFVGIHPFEVSVAPGQRVSDIDVIVERFVALGAGGASGLDESVRRTLEALRGAR